ncbi:hypothetical protein ABZ942_26745 [Nocardia sp. NPDC046473]|uniref:hypothetical protein n=1 Tax=Nocardia sp. NPDC046473 TaxID=3155733 RepID=UPI0033D976BC
MGFMRAGVERVNEYLQAAPRGPRYHGDTNDPRYPSPRELRTFTATVVDIALHAGVAAAAATSVDGLIAIPTGILVYVVTSFVHTTVVQRITAATIGKAVFALVFIRGDDGGKPTFDRLLKWYLLRSFLTVLSVLFDWSPNGNEHSPSLVAVRRRDVKALHAAHHQPVPQAHPHTV